MYLFCSLCYSATLSGCRVSFIIPMLMECFLEVGYSSDSSENPQLLAALDTLVEPVLLTLDYCGEAMFPWQGNRAEHFSRDDFISQFLIALASIHALSRCAKQLCRFQGKKKSQGSAETDIKYRRFTAALSNFYVLRINRSLPRYDMFSTNICQSLRFWGSFCGLFVHQKSACTSQII